MASIFLVMLLGAMAHALVLDETMARPTITVIPDVTLSMAPAVTVPPSPHELLKRLDEIQVLLAPDNTCGYVDRRVGTRLNRKWHTEKKLLT